ncbi:hypothetical protein RCG23_09845 [Neobacillus sp. PS3-34]|uniref:hypothetical protein n=1 Tax=Neobacillus sp. PS3-34 TaxID=3070678 RepID=UPI0027E01FDC|nr:hypothetical protein [Neobacillus sp. PS3-34]WML50107.1 hypothetical protein RCG23_09845 [Neobacillus sp. PS3-34]
MKHFSDIEWLRYVKDEVDEESREAMESHLYDCGPCLESYLNAVELCENSLPVLSNESAFNDSVMAGILAIKENPVSVLEYKSKKKQLILSNACKKQKTFYQQEVFHYFLAAAVTILLMLSGVFTSIARFTDRVESKEIEKKQHSVTDGVINKTFAWMDSLENKGVDTK